MKNKVLIIFLIIGFLLMSIVTASLVFITYLNSEYQKNYASQDPGVFKTYLVSYREGANAESIIQTLDQRDYQVRTIYDPEFTRGFAIDINQKAHDMLKNNPDVTNISENGVNYTN